MRQIEKEGSSRRLQIQAMPPAYVDLQSMGRGFSTPKARNVTRGRPRRPLVCSRIRNSSSQRFTFVVIRKFSFTCSRRSSRCSARIPGE